jgi:hypothetical protein
VSNRTLIELNHDLAGEIDRDPEAFLKAIRKHVNNIGYQELPKRIPGGRIIAARHHTESYAVVWGEYREDGERRVPRSD